MKKKNLIETLWKKHFVLYINHTQFDSGNGLFHHGNNITSNYSVTEIKLKKILNLKKITDHNISKRI